MEQTDGEILLEMNHVKKSFDGNGVLEDISLTVKKGEVVSIIGPSGSVVPHCFASNAFFGK